MKNLRYFLDKYLQERYWKKISDSLGVGIPDPEGGKLCTDDIDNLLGCVTNWESEKESPQKERRGRKLRGHGHLSLHNCIQITHPEIAGEVSSHTVTVCFSPVNWAHSHTHNTTHAAVMYNFGVT